MHNPARQRPILYPRKHERTFANVASLASATIASVVMTCSWTYRFGCFDASVAAGLSSFSSRSTIESKYGMSVSRSTPSQKLISAAAACACTLCLCRSMWEREMRTEGEGRTGLRGLRARG